VYNKIKSQDVRRPFLSKIKKKKEYNFSSNYPSPEPTLYRYGTVRYGTVPFNIFSTLAFQLVKCKETSSHVSYEYTCTGKEIVSRDREGVLTILLHR
jgi:hypothetical protein